MDIMEKEDNISISAVITVAVIRENLSKNFIRIL